MKNECVKFCYSRTLFSCLNLEKLKTSVWEIFFAKETFHCLIYSLIQFSG